MNPHSQVSINTIKDNALFILQFLYTHAQIKVYHKCIKLPFSIFITFIDLVVVNGHLQINVVLSNGM